MARKQIVSAVSEVTGLTQTDVKAVYNAMFESLKDALIKEKTVSLPGLGILRMRRAKATTARNPRTQEVIKVPVRNRVAFKVTKSLKDKVKSMKVIKA